MFLFYLFVRKFCFQILLDESYWRKKRCDYWLKCAGSLVFLVLLKSDLMTLLSAENKQSDICFSFWEKQKIKIQRNWNKMCPWLQRRFSLLVKLWLVSNTEATTVWKIPRILLESLHGLKHSWSLTWCKVSGRSSLKISEWISFKNFQKTAAKLKKLCENFILCVCVCVCVCDEM